MYCTVLYCTIQGEETAGPAGPGPDQAEGGLLGPAAQHWPGQGQPGQATMVAAGERGQENKWLNLSKRKYIGGYKDKYLNGLE